MATLRSSSGRAQGTDADDIAALRLLAATELIVLHLGATAWHAAMRRDRAPERMLPAPEGHASS